MGHTEHPSADQKFHWAIEYCDEPGFVAIKSMANGGYLDGRGNEKEVLVTHRPPNGDKFLMWQIEECEGFLTFRCKSNGHYLDGRHEAGHAAYSTGRNPQGDAYLHWTLVHL